MFANIQENARNVSCHSNLKKLGVAFSQYASDNDGALPNVSVPDGSRTWRENLMPYVRLKDTYHCPNRRDDLDASGFPQNYAVNSSPKGTFAGPGTASHMFKDFSAPGRLILVLEAENNPRPDFDIDDSADFGPQTHKLWAGHFKVHGNFLLADGHVKSFFPSSTYLYDLKNHSLFNFWYRNTDTRLSANGEAVLKETGKNFHW